MAKLIFVNLPVTNLERSMAFYEAHASAQVLLCLSEDSRNAVSATVEKAANAGGKAEPTPMQDFGFMYNRCFEDPDGHIWEVMWMDPTAAPPHAH